MSEQNDKLQGEREAKVDHEVVKFIKEKMELFESMGDKEIASEYCNILGYIRKLERAAITSDAKPITVGQILALERRCDMTDDETMRFARSVEALVLRSTCAVELVAKP